VILRTLGVALVWLAGAVPPAAGQSPLPVVEEVDPETFRKYCERLQPSLIETIRPEDYTELTRLSSIKTPAADFGEKVQKILDPYCLVGISINPESRVKAARGPWEAGLVRGRETFILAKVQNDAGATHGLTVAGEQLRTATETGKDRWLEATVYKVKPAENTLTGQRLEYVVLRLKALEAGKREATLKFDVGQGTQDLGFRAEVPILFTVKEPK
jgi:hypothetical protein